MAETITNRDIILKLEEVAEDVAVIKSTTAQTNGKVKDHEARLRPLERTVSRMLGGIALMVFALPFGAAISYYVLK